jgi:hypothetical protein
MTRLGSADQSISIAADQRQNFLRHVKEPPFSLYFNKNKLVVKIDDASKLTIAEKDRLK